MKIRHLIAIPLAVSLAACDLAEGVTVQELPNLDRASIEARLGLPEVAGPWRFAGWELQEGDTLGLEAELPTLGILNVEVQKRDSVAGTYRGAAGGEAQVEGEVRRDSVLALVVLPGGGEGFYLTGRLDHDTLWVEKTTLLESGEWRGDARPAFVRSDQPVTPFRRVRGMVMPTAPLPDTLQPGLIDSLPVTSVPDTADVAAPQPAPATPTTQPPAQQPTTQPTTQPTPPDTQPSEAAEPEPQAEPRPSGEPAVQRRQPPRVLGTPIERD